ncbi:hypothetical protein [Mucilaginibacter sp.]|uniref:hypothetical protein n=1 Tax=Mucilaginibacter sp. TaxID=1882438 RepID=UPI00284FDCA8|nr:hypothetical protein [Mucilaginibacter sp.]MDR3695376.1 hypothetical protein [Mucilaginibacter sp.]
MTETVFAGKQVKKLTFGYIFSVMAAFHTIFPRFAENFLVGYRPGDAGYGIAIINNQVI